MRLLSHVATTLPSLARPPAFAARAAHAHMLIPETSVEAASSLIAFADQAGNLAGTLFPLSLAPYAAFLYFIRYENNGLSDTAKNGFTTLLTFVFATVVCSIVGVKTFGLNVRRDALEKTHARDAPAPHRVHARALRSSPMSIGSMRMLSSS